MSNVHIELLGKTAHDRVTGFRGVVSSVSFDLYGCIQAAITPPIDKDGKLVDGRWFDVNRLELEDVTRVMPIPTAFMGVEKQPHAARPTAHAYGPAEKPERDAP